MMAGAGTERKGMERGKRMYCWVRWLGQKDGLDGWARWMGRWMGQMNEVDGWVEGWGRLMSRRMDGRMGQMDEVDGWVDGRMGW